MKHLTKCPNLKGEDKITVIPSSAKLDAREQFTFNQHYFKVGSSDSQRQDLPREQEKPQIVHPVSHPTKLIMDYSDLVHSQQTFTKPSSGATDRNSKTTSEDSRPGSRNQNSLIRLDKKELEDDFDDVSAYLSSGSGFGKEKILLHKKPILTSRP